MTQEEENKLARLKLATEHLHQAGVWHTKTELAEQVGSPRSNVVKAIAGDPRYFTDGFLRRFAAAYRAYISEAWLLTGQGRMDVPGRDERPHVVSEKDVAGFLGRNSGPVPPPPFCKPFDLMPAYDFSFRVRSDSTSHEVRPGDVLLCRRLDREIEKADIGQIFVFDDADGVTVRHLADISPAESADLLARVVAVIHPVSRPDDTHQRCG